MSPIAATLAPYVDAFFVTRGVVRAAIDPALSNAIILRVSGGTSMVGKDLANEDVSVSVEVPLADLAGEEQDTLLIKGRDRNLAALEWSKDPVGKVIAEMLGPLFEKITGAQVPVDGGGDRVI